MLIAREDIDTVKLKILCYKKNALSDFKAHREYKSRRSLESAKHWLKTYKKEKNKLLNIENADLYESKIIELFELYFPNKYDVKDNHILLHFPEVLITNTNGKEHRGTDYYFRFTFSWCSEYPVRVDATRMSATPEEIQSGYCHSHIGKCGLYGWTNSICFGDTFIWKPFEILISLEMILSNLQNFMETESTNTNPYKFISRIGFFNTEILDGVTYYTENINKIDFDLTTETEKDFTYILPIDNERLDAYLIENYSSEALCYYHNGNYYKNCADTDNIDAPNNTKFIFKGEEIAFKVLPSNHVVPDKVINPYFKRQFIQYAKSEITKKFAAITSVEPQLVIDNKRKPVQKNSIPVLQN